MIAFLKSARAIRNSYRLDSLPQGSPARVIIEAMFGIVNDNKPNVVVYELDTDRLSEITRQLTTKEPSLVLRRLSGGRGYRFVCTNCDGEVPDWLWTDH